jgi:hypothetical protein
LIYFWMLGRAGRTYGSWTSRLGSRHAAEKPEPSKKPMNLQEATAIVTNVLEKRFSTIEIEASKRGADSMRT